MCSPFPRYGLLGLAILIALMLPGCDREQRQFPQTGDGKIDSTELRVSALQPAQSATASSPSSLSAKLPDDYWKKYEGNAFAANQGKRLFRWYNCNGCHAQGGGDIGPPLMDDKWIYGSEPLQIYSTVLQGRPNGMPSFAGHIPEDQLWQIVAYVRSMSGQLRADVAPSRSDSLTPGKPESRRQREHAVATDGQKHTR